MLKEKIIVPGNIRYISEWKNFRLLNFPHILDKKIPGCGFTEYCITSNQNTIVCSPRRLLLENKEEQHRGEIYYFRSELDKSLNIDKDLLTITIPKEDIICSEKRQILDKMRDSLMNYINARRFYCLPIKLIVTYDSFRLLKEILISEGLFNEFYVVVDEFQSIFTDSRFKSDTELEFISYLRDIKNLCFVSATPMIDEYLEQLDQFRDLPYYELDWETECPGRVLRPDLKVRVIRSVIEQAIDIIKSYKSGKFESAIDININGNISEVVSTEAVIYVNSVKNIISIIKKSGLLPEDVNILCANTSDNQARLDRIAGKGKYIIGKVPLKGDPHKMFTLCTRTVYLGADFYSTCARTFILSDANIDTLAVDITLDLPQILGRQRLKENPWKNRAELYFKSITNMNKVTKEDFDLYISNKLSRTNNLLSAYSTSATSEVKRDLAKHYQKVAKTYNYKDDYVAVNTHNGKDLYPVKNELVIISEKRAFDIQQIDYADRFTVFNKLIETGIVSSCLRRFVEDFNTLPGFYEKMKAVCESDFSENERMMILEQVPILYKNLYLQMGPERLKANSYNITFIKKELYNNNIVENNNQDICSLFLQYFKIGEKYLLSDIKNTIKQIYITVGLESKPKAIEIEKYFEVRKIQVTNKETGKKDHGYEILKKKN